MTVLFYVTQNPPPYYVHTKEEEIAAKYTTYLLHYIHCIKLITCEYFTMNNVNKITAVEFHVFLDRLMLS